LFFGARSNKVSYDFAVNPITVASFRNYFPAESKPFAETVDAAEAGDDQLSVKSPRFRFPCQPSNLTILHEPDGIDLF